MSRLHGVCLLCLAMVLPSIRINAGEADLPKAIRELNHDLYRVRVAAVSTLHKGGAASVPLLVKEARYGTAESSRRSMQILDEFAYGENADARKTARAGLARLSDIDSPIGQEAKSILNRSRVQALFVFSQEKVSFSGDSDHLRRISFHDVTNFEIVVPLLAEFPELETLSFNVNKQFNDDLVGHLKGLKNLTSLDLYRTSIGNRGLETLAELPHLRRVMLGETKVTAEGLKTLGRMKQLHYLGLRGNPITDESLAEIAGLQELDTIFLGETQITDEGIPHLLKLQSLDTLYIYKTKVSDAGLRQLSGLKRLKTLYLDSSQGSVETRQALKESLPELEIIQFMRD